jgi:hypothetical protein
VLGGTPGTLTVAEKPTRSCGLNDVRSVLINRTCEVSRLDPTGIPGEKSKVTTSPERLRSAPDGLTYVA